MAQRSRKQALVPVAIGVILAGSVCVGVASIPVPVRDGTPAAVARRVADASVTVRTRRHHERYVHTVRVGNAGPDATGRLRLRTTVPGTFSVRSPACRKDGRILECDWPRGLDPGDDLTFTLVTRRRGPLVLPLKTDAVDWAPANNTARF
ncbi:hypothetical protein [Actinocorallia longicatena]|uniref:DUF11 domain-containing protein n=1 Tax=Actinocorallia longicatena TaxID=111803 RepID=A0ABP6QG15_9ACTN